MKSEFKSVFSEEMNQYLAHKIALGYKETSFRSHLHLFDSFCVEQNILEPVFTNQHAAMWAKKKLNEIGTTHYSRINGVKQFLIYLNLKGYRIFITRDIGIRKTDFQPHIYNDDEITRYFHAVDTYESSHNRKNAIQFPVLFRIFYCCGTRLNETLSIKKQNLDLKDGIIKLIETKNDCERYVVLGHDLKMMVQKFAEKSFYLLDDNDYIFTTSNGGKMSGDLVYDAHRLFLQQAKIPYIGGGKGPRIQDWRHTMAVRSFKQLIDAGMDMYVALPILSTYLGHKTIFATEHYIRLTMNIYPYIEKKLSSKMKRIFGEGF